MGNSANTFRERDPLGMMECWKRKKAGLWLSQWHLKQPQSVPHYRALPTEIKEGENNDTPLSISVGSQTIFKIKYIELWFNTGFYIFQCNHL